MANENVPLDIQCVYPLNSAESVTLQKVLRRMKRVGIAPADRDHVIVTQEREIETLRKKIRDLEERPMLAPERKNVLYLCDGDACTNCHNLDCKHTSNVLHAINFKQFGNIFFERGGADE